MTDDELKKEKKKAQHEEMKNSPSPLQRKTSIRNISPLGMRVVVAIKNMDDTTDGGLYLPETAKANSSESLLAEVLEVASAVDDETLEETNISGVPLGATVLIEKDAGVKVPWNDSLRIVDTQDILATIEEIEIS